MLMTCCPDPTEIESMQYSQLIWDLCVALWGPLGDLLAEKGASLQRSMLAASYFIMLRHLPCD